MQLRAGREIIRAWIIVSRAKGVKRLDFRNSDQKHWQAMVHSNNQSEVKLDFDPGREAFFAVPISVPGLVCRYDYGSGPAKRLRRAVASVCRERRVVIRRWSANFFIVDGCLTFREGGRCSSGYLMTS